MIITSSVLLLLGWFVHQLGIVSERKDKVANPSLMYYIKDRWPNIVKSILLSVALFILIYVQYEGKVGVGNNDLDFIYLGLMFNIGYNVDSVLDKIRANKYRGT